LRRCVDRHRTRLRPRADRRDDILRKGAPAGERAARVEGDDEEAEQEPRDPPHAAILRIHGAVIIAV
jgi:hypothetical protein